MHRGVNEVRLYGIVADDAEEIVSDGGKPSIVKVRVKTPDFYRKDDKVVDTSEWHTVKAGGHVGVEALKARKGDHVFVCGSNRTRTWSDSRYDPPVPRRSTEIWAQRFYIGSPSEPSSGGASVADDGPGVFDDGVFDPFGADRPG